MEQEQQDQYVTVMPLDVGDTPMEELLDGIADLPPHLFTPVQKRMRDQALEMRKIVGTRRETQKVRQQIVNTYQRLTSAAFGIPELN